MAYVTNPAASTTPRFRCLASASFLIMCFFLAPTPTLAQAPMGKVDQTLSGEDAPRAPASERPSPPAQRAAPSTPREDTSARKSDSPYDGSWYMASPTTSCGPGIASRVTISQGVIRGPGGRGYVTPGGSISGNWSFVGLINASLSGRMSSNSSGSGRWRNNLGCGGTWTISR